jgi:hypothetical protein
MATVNKNFRIKQGLIVEGTTGTINAQNILTETGGDAYILNLVGGATLVKSVEATQLEVSGAGKLSVKSGVFDAAGSAAAAQSAAEATAASDATSKANAAQSAAITAAATDATTKVAAEAALRVSGDAASVSTAAADATTKADAAQAAAIAAAATDATTKANAAKSGAEATAAADATTKAANAKSEAISAAASDATTKANAALTSAQGYTDTAVSNLVNGAPELLNTLDELAQALGDAPDTITNLTTSIGNKLPLAGGILTGALTLSGAPTVDLEAATKKYVDDNTYLADMSARGYADGAADDAEAAAITAAAADATTKVAAEAALRISGDAASVSTAAADATTKANAAQAAAEATAAAANTAQQNGTTAFTALNVNDQAKQIAASSTSLGSVVVTAYEWPKADYRSGKFVVKIDNGTHNEISEILLTLDSSDNVAITEYAIVGTNGSRGTITADVSGSNVRVRVNPVNDSTVKITGTLLK